MIKYAVEEALAAGIGEIDSLTILMLDVVAYAG